MLTARVIIVIAMLIAFPLFSYCETNNNGNNNQNNNSKLTLTVYYESLCPACQFFFENQFGPNWEQLSTAVEFELVPYGRATIDDKGTVQCKHGEPECFGNALQACALDKIKDLKQKLNFVACFMKDINKGQLCGEQNQVNYSDLETCAKSNNGLDLIQKLGQRTDEAKLKWVPYMTFNNEMNDDLSNQVHENMVQTVCDKLNRDQWDQSKIPEVCSKSP